MVNIIVDAIYKCICLGILYKLVVIIYQGLMAIVNEWSHSMNNNKIEQKIINKNKGEHRRKDRNVFIQDNNSNQSNNTNLSLHNNDLYNIHYHNSSNNCKSSIIGIYPDDPGYTISASNTSYSKANKHEYKDKYKENINSSNFINS